MLRKSRSRSRSAKKTDSGGGAQKKPTSRSRSKTPKGSRKVTIGAGTTTEYPESAPVAALTPGVAAARKMLKQELKKRRAPGQTAVTSTQEHPRSPTPHPSRGVRRELPAEGVKTQAVQLSPGPQKKRPSKEGWWKGWKSQKDQWQQREQSFGKSSKKGKGKGKKKTGKWQAKR